MNPNSPAWLDVCLHSVTTLDLSAIIQNIDQTDRHVGASLADEIRARPIRVIVSFFEMSDQFE